MEISNKLFPVVHHITVLLHNMPYIDNCIQAVCGHLDHAGALSPACSHCHAFHSMYLGDVVVGINHFLHTNGVCDRWRYLSSKYLSVHQSCNL